MILGKVFYKFRGYTPVPFLLLSLIYARFSLPMFLTGLVVVILGEIMRFWSVCYNFEDSRDTMIKTRTLVTAGPYQLVRNPIYLGNLMIYCGVMVLTDAIFPYLFIATFLFFTLQYFVIIIEEEKYLLEEFGIEFINYKQKVNRFVPGCKNSTYRFPEKADLGNGIKSEKSTFISFLVYIILFIVIIIWKSA